MEGNAISIPINATVPLTDVMRARVSDGRVALPVRGALYARLQHINAVPSGGGSGGYSLSRLQAIDSLLSRIANLRDEITPQVDQDVVERHQEILEEATRRVVDDIERGGNGFGLAEGFLLDMTA